MSHPSDGHSPPGTGVPIMDQDLHVDLDGSAMTSHTPPPTTVDLAALERTLCRRACWHEDPEAYREGVHETVEELRRSAEDGDEQAAGVLAV